MFVVKHMRNLLLPAIVLSVLANSAQAQGITDAKLKAIEDAIDQRRQQLHIAGASLVIVKDDKVIYIKGLGERDVERGLPVTPDTQFAIGSSSKAFTAMTIMMNQEAGKLQLADSPKKYLSYFKMKDPEADAKMTIRDLLCHRSGLQRTDMAWATGKLSRKQIIQVAGEAVPTAKYGQAWQYQNVMFLAAGELAATLQNTTWDDLVKQRIFKPLGMNQTNTRIQTMQASNDFARGYAWNGTGFTVLPMRDISCIAPAGAINSSAREMAQWVRLMLGKGQIDGKRLITEASWEELTKPHMKMGPAQDYGLGWFLSKWNGHKVVEHAGNIDGFNAQVALMPDQNLGFCLLTNISGSPLSSESMKIVWQNLVGGEQKAVSSTQLSSSSDSATVPAEKEAGTYWIKAANVSMEVTYKDQTLRLHAPAQPPYPLERISGRKYKLGAPAPDGFFMTFRPSSSDPKVTEVFLEQPQGNVVMVREATAAYKAPISADELMAKVIQALGGDAAVRKHRSLIAHYSANIENMGVTVKGVRQQVAPNKYLDEETLFGVGRPIGRTKTVYDGKRGADVISFAGTTPRSGATLGGLDVIAAFYPEADWKTTFKKVEITGTGKVGSEEVYVVRLTGKDGTTITQHVSTQSFRVLKSELPGGISSTYEDFRTVDGVLVPFKEISTVPGRGRTVTTTEKLEFNRSIPSSRFRVPEGFGGKPWEPWADEPFELVK
jgi:CubicO group peptidase (beta-lactamase class C family)